MNIFFKHLYDSGPPQDDDRAAMPHCDSRVLHAPGECEYCDKYPEWQQARTMWAINFTGKNEPGLLPCPSETQRDLETINFWPGNRPYVHAES